MSFSLTNNPYSFYQAPAFVGMKEDSMDDNVDTFSAGGDVPIGVAVQRTAASAMTVKPGAALGMTVGVSLHDQIAGYWQQWPALYAAPTTGYKSTMAVSVLTRGRVWVAVSDGTGVVDGAGAKADPITGQFNTTGISVTNAVFRSQAINLFNADFTSSTLAAVVELHNPNV